MTFNETLEDEIFQGLRLLEGFEFNGILKRLKKEKKEDFKRKLAELESLELLKVKKGKVILTAKGLIILNKVCIELFDSIDD